jgi:hypothetical protein
MLEELQKKQAKKKAKNTGKAVPASEDEKPAKKKVKKSASDVEDSD